MKPFYLLLILCFPALVSAQEDGCCEGVSCHGWCDSSAGRYVVNGEYTSCYCDRHAVMDLQKFMGCCEWHGGVLKITPVGSVICNDMTVSELCTLQHPEERIAAW